MPSRKNLVADRVAGLFERTDVQSSTLQSVQTSERQDDKPKRVKVTVYVPPDVDVLLRTIQVNRLAETGAKPELSELVTEAIRLLGRQNSETG